MDALSRLLDGPRARGAFLLRSVLTPPWSLRILDRAPLTLVAVVRGEAWIAPDAAPPVRLAPGDVTVVRGPDAYTVADHPERPPRVVIHPGQRCTTPEGDPLPDTAYLGVRTWGDGAEGPVTLLTGTYHTRGETTRRLLEALPPVLAPQRSPLVAMLAEEIVKDEPGQEAVLDRLLDLLLISVLRAWLSREGGQAPSWYRAYGDPVVGRALRAVHRDPARPWTVAALAAEAGVSRAALARRFTDLVGEPPMAYLTGWRLALAADLLRETDATVGAVAAQVGYGSAFALSAAFTRTYGVSPRRHREGRLPGPDARAEADAGAGLRRPVSVSRRRT